MGNGRITKKQEEILEYIKSQILVRGFPPSVREICDAVGLKSTSSVHSHLETLEKNGYIRRDPTKPRAIEILDENFNLTRREMVQVPILGRVAAGEAAQRQLFRESVLFAQDLAGTFERFSLSKDSLITSRKIQRPCLRGDTREPLLST